MADRSRFEVDPFRKHCLLNGLDDIGLTMEKAASIDAFEAQAVAGAALGLTHCPDWGTY
jgi:3-isopropylmalate dehydratase small subunit